MAQDKPADNMQILLWTRSRRTKSGRGGQHGIDGVSQGVLAGLRRVSEGSAKINQRIIALLENYADDARKKSLTDDKAKKLIDEAIAIDQAEANLKSGYAPKLSKALPAIKVARYLQIENKIRAVIKYDLAQGVPLVR
jgi:hypothetical protein